MFYVISSLFEIGVQYKENIQDSPNNIRLSLTIKRFRC